MSLSPGTCPGLWRTAWLLSDQRSKQPEELLVASVAGICTLGVKAGAQHLPSFLGARKGAVASLWFVVSSAGGGH